MITLDDLDEILETEAREAIKYRIADLFIQAMNDWPSQVVSVEDYISQVKNVVGKDLVNLKNLEELSARLKPQNDAWMMESITNLKTILKISESENLDSITKILLPK